MRLLTSVFAVVLGTAPAVAETFDCVINPALIVQVGGPVSGLLQEVYVDQGDLVSPGQEIARLRSEVEETALAVLSLEAESMAEIEAQQSRLTLAQQRFERVQEMVRRNIAPREELEAAQAETEVIERELAIAGMRRQVAALQLERARQQIAQRIIVSPVEGVVVTRHLFNGEFLDQDSPVVTIAQINPLHVEAFLPVYFYGAVAQGMVLQVLPDAPVEGTYNARIDVVDRVFDAASGTFGIRALLSNDALNLPAGHRCQIEVTRPGQ